MSLYTLYIFLNHSIVIAAVAGIARVKYILRSYYPFLFFLWLGLANETLSLILIEHHLSNSVNSNMYVLFEYILLLFQFYQWKEGGFRGLSFFMCAGILIWVADNFILHRITDANSVFRSFASFVILFLSISKINSLVIFERGKLARNAAFIICVAFLLFYGCKAFVEVFHIFMLPFTSSFFTYLWLTFSIVNCVANLIYAIAVVCIPTKEEFILPY